MKLIHLSDLHIGKKVNGFSMIEDQKYILEKILGIIDDEKPDGIIIAGDVYDKSAPAEEAVKLLDDFLTKLAERKQQVFIISGNHDSASKLSFGARLMDKSGIHIAGEYSGKTETHILDDGDIRVKIHMLPYISKVSVRAAFPDEAEEINDTTDACRVAVGHMETDSDACNVLIAHQFVTGAEISGSEEAAGIYNSDIEKSDIVIGGVNNIDVSVFEKFDYVALGHIHRPQSVGRDTVRYCGTPLKYSFSEVNHKKSVSVVEIERDTDDLDYKISVRTEELKPLRDMREIRGDFESLINKQNYEGTNREDYIHAILTNENDVLNVIERLRTVYPNIMKISYDNERTRKSSVISDIFQIEKKSPLEIFKDFYKMQNGTEMSDEQVKLVTEIIDEIFREG